MFPIIDKDNVPELPDEVIIDPLTNMAINVPAVQQGPPYWWENAPVYDRIKRLRKEAGIEVNDFPDGKPVRQKGRRISMDERLAKMKESGS